MIAGGGPGWMAFRRLAGALPKTPAPVRALLVALTVAAFSTAAQASDPAATETFPQVVAREAHSIAAPRAVGRGALQPIHFFRDQLQTSVPDDAPGYRQIWTDCAPARTRADLLATPRQVRDADPASAVRIAGCAALAELRCAVAGTEGVRSEAIPGFHLIRTGDGRFRLVSAGHVLTFSYIRAQRRSGGADFVFERDCLITVGGGVPLAGARLSPPHFLDPALSEETLPVGDADFWSSEPHDGADLGYFDLTFDPFPQAAASRAVVNAIALRTYSGPPEGLAPFATNDVCSFGTGFMGSFERRVRINGCVATGGVEMQASRLEAGRCRFRAPTTAYFSGAPLVGRDEVGPIALCVISSEPGNEPSSPIAGGIPIVERGHARRYSPGLANNGVIYPAD